MLMKGVTLKGLLVFDALAATGSVAQAASRTGLSQPAVSQQIRNLEKAMGQNLLDHSRRPMQLTPAGRTFIARTRNVLAELRLAQNELTMMDLGHLEQLSLGIIDDFDNDLTPRLATMLAENMTRCRFKLLTAPSHEIANLLEAGDLHMAICAEREEEFSSVNMHPIAKDPFVLVCPKGVCDRLGGAEAVMQALPMLRYQREQMIGQRIERELTAQGLTFSDRFELGAHQSLMTLVSRGVGWAITTPLGYMRVARLHDDIEMHPLPFDSFSRNIVLYAGADWSDHVPNDVARIMRLLIQDFVIRPALAQQSWLDGQLTLLDAEPANLSDIIS